MSETIGSSAPAASSAAPNTAAQTTTAGSSTPASATATPAQTATTSAAPASSGEPPPERWDDILANARTKTRAEVEAEYRQKYGWADQFQQDPYAFVDSWVDQLAAHPQYQPQILAKAARLLQSRRGTAPTEEPPPDVPIVDANGTVTGQTYSAAQLKKWRDWDWAQKQSAIDQRLQPLEQMRQQHEQAQVLAQIQHESDQHAQATLTELRKDPYFTEHEPKVKKMLADHPEWGDDIYRAFHAVLQAEVFPSITRTAEGKVLAQLQTQASGASVRPSGGGSQLPDFRAMEKKQPGFTVKYMNDHPEIAEQFAKR